MLQANKEKLREIGLRLLKSWQFYILLITLGAMLWLAASMLHLELFEASTTALCFGLGLIVLFLAGYILYYKKGWLWKCAAGILCGLVVLACTFGQSAAGVLASSLRQISQPVTTLTRTAGLYTYSQVPVRTFESLNGQTLGVLDTRNQNLNEAILNSLAENKVTVRTRGFSSLQAMMKALKGQAIRAVILSPSDLELIEEFSGMEKIRSELVQFYSVPVDLGLQTEASTLNLDQDPYTVLISGSNDPITQASYRSSLNVILTVNPAARTMLLTFVPRSAWVSYTCKEGLACPADTQDKAGFASLYTIEALKDTLQSTLGITIDFTVRADLNSLLRIADLTGGIQVQNDQEFTNGYFSFAQGEIEMDSPRARQYIGTLNDFSSTDQNQEKNQLNVLLALLREVRQQGAGGIKEILEVIDSSVKTSFTYAQTCQLVRQMFMNPQNWNELYYALSGSDGLEFSGSLTEYAYALLPDAASIQKAKAAIEAVLAGSEPDVEPIAPAENTENQTPAVQQPSTEQTPPVKTDTSGLNTETGSQTDAADNSGNNESQNNEYESGYGTDYGWGYDSEYGTGYDEDTWYGDSQDWSYQEDDSWHEGE